VEPLPLWWGSRSRYLLSPSNFASTVFSFLGSAFVAGQPDLGPPQSQADQ
jgi:hypothetical protein